MLNKVHNTSLFNRFVSNLQKYMSIDIYGKCGLLKCPGRMSDKCYRILERNYKFYLSFENDICSDYVTEKFFYILE